MRIKFSGFVISGVLCIQVVSAQEIKLAGIDYFNYGKAPLKSDGPAEGNISFQEFTVYANYVKRLKNNKTIMINGVRYGWVQPTLQAPDATVSNAVHFHSIIYNLRLIHSLKNNWTAGLVLTPTLASDFKSALSGDDFVMQGAVTLTKKLKEKTYIGAGLAYTTSLGVPVPLPVFIYLHHTGRHSFHIFLPSVASYNYTIDRSKKLKAGLRFGINGAYFNYSGTDAIAGQHAADKINYSRGNFGPTISYKITSFLQLEGFGGISTMRHYRYQDVSGNEIKFDSQASSFFNIGITLVPPERK